MVFSFFKKAPEKMVARPAAVPRSREAPTGVSPPVPPSGRVPETVTPPAKPAPVAPVSAAEISTSDIDSSIDFVFSESSPDFQLETEIDPIDAEVEEAAVLFANSQDAAVRSVLENAVRIHQFGPGERLWLMLFDLYRLLGQKDAFEVLETDYVRSFEKSPPGWSDQSKGASRAKDAAAGSQVFKGQLTGDNDAAFDAVCQALDVNPRLRLDLSKVDNLDAEGCGRLLTRLKEAKKARRNLELLGREGLAALLEARVEPGRQEDRECWILLLELYQLQGQQQAFEDVAINYAVTFEISPPSWEPGRIAAPEPVCALATETAADPDAGGDAYVCRGEIKSSRFADLSAYAETRDHLIIECAALTRMDFISAGALLNVLSTIRRSGKQIVFRHPNHLVAELFGIVGLNAVATIVFAKN